MPDTIQPGVYSINGVIYDELDNPLPNMIVKVYDKDFRSEQFLGENLTGAKGNYKIEFNSQRAENPEYESVDIFIKVFDAAGALLGQSPIHFNISGATTINYKIGNTAYKGISEFDALLRKIRPVLEPQQVPLGKLEENGHYQDISFLAGELRENATVSFINTAFNLSNKTRMLLIFLCTIKDGLPG